MQKKYLIVLIAILNLQSLSAQIISFSPSRIIGGMSQTLILTGNNFGVNQGNSYVSFLQESGQYLDPTLSKALKYISWSDNAIELEMPVAFSGKVKININGNDYYSSDTLKVMANLGYRAANPLTYDHLTNTNNRGGYTWYIHKTYWNIPEAKSAIEEVFKEIRCKTGINYILAPFYTEIGFNLGDTFNVIAPDPQLGPVGYNERLWTSCILGNETFFNIKSHDLHLSVSQDWYFGEGDCPSGKTKFRYVLFHELGHSMGLGHVNELGQTMYPSVSFLPSNSWSGRDTMTEAENNALSYFVNVCQNFNFRACGISPLSKIFNCQDVYGTNTNINSLKKEDFYIYPNPAIGEVFVESESTPLDGVQFILTDYTGKVVLSSIYSKSGIPTSDLNQGLYFVIFQNIHSNLRIKFYKQ